MKCEIMLQRSASINAGTLAAKPKPKRKRRHGTVSTSALYQPMPSPTYRPYRVTTSMGAVTVLARTLAAAIVIGLELTGPSAQLLSCLQEGDW